MTKKKRRAKTAQKKFDTRVTTMTPVTHPVPGRFYALGHRQSRLYDDTIVIYSEKEFPTAWIGNPAYARKVMGEVTEGQMVYYVGPSQVYRYHKVGFEDFFGLVEKDLVVFYDLGDIGDV